MKRIILALTLLFTMLSTTACWEAPGPNRVSLQTIYGEFKQVVRPPGIWTILTWGDDYHPFSLEQVQLEGASYTQTDNGARFKWPYRIFVKPINDNKAIEAQVRATSYLEEKRSTMVAAALKGKVESLIGAEASKYDAYKLVENRQQITDAVKGQLTGGWLASQGFELANFELVGPPDFDNDEIDGAAGKVTAAQQRKQEAEADLERQKIANQTAELKNVIMRDPNALRLELLNKQLEIEKARASGIAGHSGPLTIINGDMPQTRLDLSNK